MDDSQLQPQPEPRKQARKQPTKPGGDLSVNTPVAQVSLPNEVAVGVTPAVRFILYCIGVAIIFVAFAYSVSMLWKPQAQQQFQPAEPDSPAGSALLPAPGDEPKQL